MKIRLLLVNLFALGFFVVEQGIINPQKRLYFLERFEPPLEQEINALFSDWKKSLKSYKHQNTIFYDEVLKKISFAHSQIKEAVFISPKGKILNSVKNSPSFSKRKNRLILFTLNQNIKKTFPPASSWIKIYPKNFYRNKSGQANSVFNENNLYSYKQVILSGERLYLIVLWNYQRIPFGLYIIIFVGLFSIYAFVNSSIKTHDLDEKLSSNQIEKDNEITSRADILTRKVDEVIQQAENEINHFGQADDHIQLDHQEDTSSEESFWPVGEETIWKNFEANEKEYLLIDPVLEECRQNIKRLTRIITTQDRDKLRDKVFNPETKELIQRVIQEVPSSLKESLQQLNDIQVMFDQLKKSSQSNLLENIYFTRPTQEKGYKELTKSLEFMAHNFQADSAIFLSQNRSLNCYEPITGFGMPSEAWRNFYILEDDPILPITTPDSKEESLLAIDKKRDKEFYFVKRLNQEEASQIEWIYSHPLHFAQTNGLLVFFYKKSHKKEQIERFKEDAKNKLTDFIPILRRGILKDNTKNQEAYNQSLKDLKYFISKNDSPVKIVHLYPSQPISASYFEKQKKTIQTNLHDNEYFFYYSPKHLLAYLSKTDVKNLISQLEKILGRLDHEVRQYSDKISALDYYLL